MTPNFLQDWLTKLLGNDAIPIVVVCALPLVFILVYALIAILGEMKISAWMQDRVGPMRTGWKGTFQPFADILKLMQKEDTTPSAVDKFLYNMAPYIVFIGAYAAFAALPFSSAYMGATLNVGIFYIVAISSLAVVGILMAGWASNNKYSLYGAIRSVSQIISYEIPAGLAILCVVMIAGTLDLNQISAIQSGGIQNWFIFGGPFPMEKRLLLLPVMIVLFIIYYITSLAETNRTPFDIAEGESELVAGYHTEYSAMKFAIFFLAEYANMFAVSAVAATLFFGGWQSPFGEVLGGPVWGIMWFVLKSFFFVFVQIWLRWSLPRLRVDQLMSVCWKFLLPFTLVCVVATALIVLNF
ncbi:MAG TPA: NADH-quinone oxidoreductase subunit NuoH [Candidatus Kapabacteria bacterium]|nr:NADH-quinone oxidoreductase subunit NuoH [Candidatus Kapabacteria bacterium]